MALVQVVLMVPGVLEVLGLLEVLELLEVQQHLDLPSLLGILEILRFRMVLVVPLVLGLRLLRRDLVLLGLQGVPVVQAHQQVQVVQGVLVVRSIPSRRNQASSSVPAAGIP